MSRKFITVREHAFIESITRELHQHVADEECFFYAVLLDQTSVNSVYDGAVRKVWAPPVKLTARFMYDNPEAKSGLFGSDQVYASEAYVHAQELVDRNVQPRNGDFIEHGNIFYEITSATKPQVVFGQIQRKLMVKLKLVPSRERQFQAGSDSFERVDRSHPVSDKSSFSRQSPDKTLPTFASGSAGTPAFAAETGRVSGQEQLPQYSNATRPAANLAPGLEIFNTDAHQEQVSDGAHWRDEEGNIVG